MSKPVEDNVSRRIAALEKENRDQQLEIQSLSSRLESSEQRMQEAERKLKDVTAAVFLALDPEYNSPDAIERLRIVARGWR